MAEDHEDQRPSKRVRLDEPGQTAQMEDDTQKEERAGIACFMNPDVAGFSGIFKQRYSDFLVNEIATSGEVLHLTDIVQAQQSKDDTTEYGKNEEVRNAAVVQAACVGQEPSAVPKEPTPQDDPPVQPEKPKAVAADLIGTSTVDREAVASIFGEKTTCAILRLFRAVQKQPDRRRRDFDKIQSEPIDDKGNRTAAHQLIRRVFDSKLETTTGEANKITIMAAVSIAGRQRRDKWQVERSAGQDRSSGRLGWHELGGEYLHFTLYKENKDTMEIISFLSGVSRQHTKNFQFAGTKDRRGITVQRISSFRMKQDRLAGLAKALNNAKIGNPKYEKEGLRLGQLQGNQFVITLRDCHFAGEHGLDIPQRLKLAQQIVSQAASSMRTRGFINYYGLQRFGSFVTGTDEIGIKLLQGDLKGAVQLILSYSSDVLAAANGGDPMGIYAQDDRKRALALETWEMTHDSKKALELMPRRFSAESSIIRHLGYQRNGKRPSENDWQGALMQIQRNLRLMYVHAYQSLVWNVAAGFRFETYGNRLVQGDLVIDQKTASGTSDPGVDEAGEIVVQPASQDRAVGEQDFVRARPISQEEVDSGNFTIADVVLPLPGYDVVYPSNQVGNFYKDFMGSERGGKLNPYDMRRKLKDISLSGGYRKFVAYPDFLQCSVKAYCNETEQLVKTDLDRLHEAQGIEQAQASGSEPSINTASDKLAVIVQMRLGSSQYATIALREMLKAGGLKSYHALHGKSK